MRLEKGSRVLQNYAFNSLLVFLAYPIWILHAHNSVLFVSLTSCGMKELRIPISPFNPKRSGPLIPHNFLSGQELIDLCLQLFMPKKPSAFLYLPKSKKNVTFHFAMSLKGLNFLVKKMWVGLSEPDRPIRLFWKVALFARHSPEIINPPQNPIIFDLSRHYSLPLSLSQFEFRSLIQYFPLFWNSGKTVQLHSCSQFQNPRKIFSTPKTISSTPTSASIRF